MTKPLDGMGATPSTPWSVLGAVCLPGTSLVLGASLCLDEAFFAGLWDRGFPPVAHTALLAALLVAFLASSWRRTRNLARFLAGLSATAVLLAGIGHSGTATMAVAIGLLLSAVSARSSWKTGRSPHNPELRRWAWGVSLALVAAVAVVATRARWRPLPRVPGASRTAVAYLVDAIRLIERFSLRRDAVDWTEVRRAALERISGAHTPADTHDALRGVLAALGDQHSSLEPKSAAPLRLASGGAPPEVLAARAARAPVARLIEGTIGYVLVPWFITGLTDGPAWRTALDQGLATLDGSQLQGWIIDLRLNAGGNMWPALDGLAPLLGEGRVGGVDMPQWSRRTDWWAIGGRAYAGVPLLAGPRAIVGAHRRLAGATLPVAVLIGPLTQSSGEAVAIAFRGRPRTRFFGKATAGLSTANMPVELSDGTRVILTVGIDLDRSGRGDGGPVVPDQVVPGSDVSPDSPAIRAAVSWMRSEPGRTLPRGRGSPR